VSSRARGAVGLLASMLNASGFISGCAAGTRRRLPHA
jgi:hypothetical protein